MAEQSDILISAFQEHCTQLRHHETQRSNMTSIIVVVAAGVLAFIANNGVTKDKWPLALFLIFIGIFGALFSAKQYEMLRWNKTIAKKYKEELEMLSKLGLSAIRANADAEHRKRFPILKKLRLFYFWIVLHSLIAGLGLFLLAYVLRK